MLHRSRWFWGLTPCTRVHIPQYIYNGCMLFDASTGDVFLDVFEAAPVRELKAGEALIHAGAKAEQVFNIVSGTLMVSRIGNDGRRQVLSFLFRDNFVGLSATDTYFFSVEAVTSATVVCRPRQVLEKRLEQDSVAERAFLNMVFRVLENALDLVYSLGQRTAIERLAVFLLYLRHRHLLVANLPEESPQLDTVDLPMSRQDMADFLGLKKETVSRSFTQLDERGLISRPDNFHAVILDLGGLRELAGIQDFSSPLRLVAVP
jgi:CRP/FNR family transcriptional regulator